ncbi:MAG: DUF366 family protein [Gemmatimonadales bacterium]|nr:DUF366 family protein [Gemmatimonadales bacterium]
MKTQLLEDVRPYTGAQLHSGWIEEVAGLSGDAAIAFLGPCNVSPEHMVDRSDLEAGAQISSPQMVHVIVEHIGLDLDHTTTRQRLLMALASEILNSHLGEALIQRRGDDLYLGGRKLSVSVATASPRSGLIHSGFNVRGEGAPVPAIGLEELGIAPRTFAEALLEAYREEIESAQQAALKVKPVR